MRHPPASCRCGLYQGMALAVPQRKSLLVCHSDRNRMIRECELSCEVEEPAFIRKSLLVCHSDRNRMIRECELSCEVEEPAFIWMEKNFVVYRVRPPLRQSFRE